MLRSHRREILLRVGVAACMTLLGLALWQPAGWAQADAAAKDDKIEVVTDIEAWYNTSPLPGGALPVVPPPTNPYEEHTLHVRITNGEENARTYVSLDTADLPLGARITGGTLILPLDPTESDLGDDRKALFQVCLADPITARVSGSFDAPPEVDCKLRSGAIYERKPEPHFIVDLGPVVDFLETNSLALVPTNSAMEQSDTWHVAFYDKKNESKDAAPITAELDINAADPGEAAPPPTTVSPADEAPAPIDASGPEVDDSVFGSSSLDIGTGSLTSDSPEAADTPVVAAPEQPQQVAAAPPAASPVAASGPAYTVVWALPLVMLLLGAYFSSALTRQVVVRKRMH